MKYIKQLMVSAMLLGASVGAHATDYDLGVLNAGFTGFGANAVSGSFLDKINFALGGDSAGSFGAGPLNFSVGHAPILNISNLSMSLFDSSANHLGSGLDFTLSSLSAGSYYLQVTGVANGAFGGIYAGGIDVSPVPEPGVWSSLMAGLAMLGFMAYRRRQL